MDKNLIILINFSKKNYFETLNWLKITSDDGNSDFRFWSMWNVVFYELLKLRIIENTELKCNWNHQEFNTIYANNEILYMKT